MTELEEARKRISAIDKDMARLFVERMRVIEGVAAFKKLNGLPVTDPAREEAVLDLNCRLVEDPVLQEYYLQFINNIIACSKAYQERLLKPESFKLDTDSGEGK